MGARVIASVGSDEKAELLRSYGVDAIINYKPVAISPKRSQKAAPEGLILLL